MKLTRYGIALILLALGLWSCGPKKENTDNSDEFKKAEESLEDEIKDLEYNLPSPTEIPYLLQQTGAEFNQSLINDKKKVDQYMTRNDKGALNLGVYASDIGYLISYDKTQEAIDYVTASKKLANSLGVLGAFDQEILKQFEANISKKDSLTELVDKAVKQTEKYLKGDNRLKPAALMIAGSFVEGLYISTGLIKSYPKTLLKDDDRMLVLTPLIRVILQQRQSVGELVKMLGTVEQTEPVVGLLANLNSLDASYRALNIEEKIKNNQANEILTDKNLADITKTVEAIRKSIVD
ncbi:MAG TPA: hypothetical protein DGG95_18000 [Cytophagales bacterium]|jgi:hypothetical protein|nr:hypothetical protein [Cytophagales bacterium]